MNLRAFFSVYKKPSRAVSPEEHEERKAMLRRKIVAKSSSGNIGLQAGKYSTKRDLDKRKAQLFTSS